MEVNSRWRRNSGRRPNKGSMLFMCTALLAMAIIIVGLGTWVYFLFFTHKMLKNQAEDFSLQAAQQLNANDYSGKLNNLICRSRELVFSARQMQMLAEADPEFEDYKPLAEQVLAESRESIKIVNEERSRFANLTIDRLRTMVDNVDRSPVAGLSIVGLSTGDCKISDLRVGWLTKVESNVVAPTGNFELYGFDRNQPYFQVGRDTDYYKANVNLKLPGQDSDLDFILSPLPAPVKGTSAPMRLVRADTFKAVLPLRKDGQTAIGNMSICPSAVQVVMAMGVKEKVVGKLESGSMTIDTASTNGACSEPD